jgi:hypothetical protein
MRFLLFSFVLLLASCASEYKALKPGTFDQSCLEKIKPKLLHTKLYDAGIDVMGKHISGLLLVKTFDSGAKRVVFTNEAGVKFLDFGWSTDEMFHSYFIMKQLNKKAVIELLRRDFELLIGYYYEHPGWTGSETSSEYFMSTPFGHDRFYVVTDNDCTKFIRAELGSKRKRIVSLEYLASDKVLIKHYTFNMQMNLKAIERE